MSDATPPMERQDGGPDGTPEGPPPLALSLVHDFAQKALTAAAAALAARGLIAPSQEAALVQLGSSAVLFAVSCLWTLIAARLRRARLRAALDLASINHKGETT